MTQGVEEQGIVVGNAYDKYGSRNPIVRYLMRGFETALQALVNRTQAKEIHEVGCGEGYWTIHWLQQGIKARGSDFSTQAIELAKANAKEQNVQGEFQVASIYDLQANDAAEVIVCCEVLEHLEYPEQALQVLQSLVKQYLIISVPREPLWKAMNMARGKYWRDLGNTPGHIQHWSKPAFIKLVGQYFDVIEVRAPTPWTMLLAKKKQA
jgi:2-polyprenyl-3-methyl-5-hydroxy-6-metoxy-1,4-benzoquinol methylase